jgi:hypothetical protein
LLKVASPSCHKDPQVVTSVLERAKLEAVNAQIRVWLHPTIMADLTEIRPDFVKSREEQGRTIEVVASGGSQPRRGVV